MESMIFDRKTLQQFKRVYQTAANKDKEQFTFLGKLFLVSYAKYLIEYLEKQLH